MMSASSVTGKHGAGPLKEFDENETPAVFDEETPVGSLYRKDCHVAHLLTAPTKAGMVGRHLSLQHHHLM